MKDKEILYTIKEDARTINVYKDYSYEHIEDGNPTMEGVVYGYSDLVSKHFNQLKAQLFNLAETSTSDKEQRDAMKGLIRNFCNEAFQNTLHSLDFEFELLGLRPRGSTQMQGPRASLE